MQGGSCLVPRLLLPPAPPWDTLRLLAGGELSCVGAPGRAVRRHPGQLVSCQHAPAQPRALPRGLRDVGSAAPLLGLPSRE